MRIPVHAGRSLLYAFVVVASATFATAEDIRSFTAGSFQELRAASAGQPLVVAFWSVNCEPCKEELTVLTRLHRSFPSVRIVIVAADAPELRPAVVRFLGRYQLGKIEAWQFEDESDERLRYSVDHAWRGELPRSYFFDAKGNVSPQSGVPDPQWAEDWFKRVSGPAPPVRRASSARSTNTGRPPR